jgi:hypothetical protein
MISTLSDLVTFLANPESSSKIATRKFLDLVKSRTQNCNPEVDRLSEIENQVLQPGSK